MARAKLFSLGCLRLIPQNKLFLCGRLISIHVFAIQGNIHVCFQTITYREKAQRNSCPYLLERIHVQSPSTWSIEWDKCSQEQVRNALLVALEEEIKPCSKGPIVLGATRLCCDNILTYKKRNSWIEITHAKRPSYILLKLFLKFDELLR